MTDKLTTHQAEDDTRNESILIYVNGQIVPRAEATVSVYDSGFMLGDGVWEGLRQRPLGVPESAHGPAVRGSESD